MKLCPREGPLKAKNETQINKIRRGYRSSNPFEGTSASNQPLRRSRRESKFKLAIFLVFYSTFLKNTVKHAFETPFLSPPRVSLMKFSSTNPIRGKNQTFSSTNPFGGKKVAKVGHRSATPSEGTSAFNQPFRLKPVSPRRGTRKTRKRSYEHGKRFLID